MKSLLALFVLALGLSVPVRAADDCCSSTEEAGFAPAGGKSSRQHSRARVAKAEAKEKAAAKAEAAKADAAKSGAPVAEQPKVEWTPRATRHKQTMPAVPTLEGAGSK